MNQDPETSSLIPESYSRYARNAPYAKKPSFTWLYALIMFCAVTALLRIFILEVTPVDGVSMERTLFSDEQLLVDRLCYHIRRPLRGEIVICRYPNDRGVYVKRIVALEGEYVAVVGGAVFVNGAPLDEGGYWQGAILGDMPEQRVPNGHIFVVGDNRNRSVDSRMPHVGAIPMRSVNGKAIAVVWPLGRFRVL